MTIGFPLFISRNLTTCMIRQLGKDLPLNGAQFTEGHFRMIHSEIK